MSILNLFYNPSKRVIGSLEKKVAEINALEDEIKKLTDEELKAKTGEFKQKLQVPSTPLRSSSYEGQAEYREDKENELLEEITAEAFAVLREAMRRVWGERHFDVQLIGGLVLHQGKIAEMKTGEGKTIAAALALYLNALAGEGVHLITVNDYLSKHQGEGMGEVYNFLGLSTGVIQSNQETYKFVKKVDYKHYSDCDGSNLELCSRHDAYAADITYGTNNEFGFDYLRDNMAPSVEACAQRKLNFAIVDEVDSILIDEARTPLIISAPAQESGSMYAQFATLVPRLKSETDYVLDEKDKAVTLTDQGIKEMEKMLHVDNIYEVGPEGAPVGGGLAMVHHLEQALKAETLFKRDRDYVVRDGEIIIVDEFTGRLMVGRRYSEGLHQAIEAKENVEVKQESQTLATISFQNLFRLYDKLAGMTGTAATEAEEFFKIYELDVVEIPTNKPIVRKDLPDRIYKSEEAKFDAVVESVKELNASGQPVLIGTVSVSKNEILSKKLKQAGVKHEVLNAKQHDREAKIIIKAGQKDAVTVATNMAGRGTDIKLGVGVRESGGLHVLGTERHEARRIDNQLRGRAGRQGDPGSSQFFVSMEDDLMRIFGGEKLKNLMNSLGLPDDMPIENKLISRSIESAQRRVEGYNFDSRKHLVEYDDVMNKHREVIYRKRRTILEGQRDGETEGQRENLDSSATSLLRYSDSLKSEIIDIINEEVINIFGLYVGDDEKIKMELKAILGDVDLSELDADKVKKFARELYDSREAKLTASVMRQVEKMVYLRTIDMLWIEHLTTMDELRTGIGLQGYGQKDPLVEYKQAAFRMFEGLLKTIESNVARTIFKVEVAVNQSAPPVTNIKQAEYSSPDADTIGGFEEKLKDEKLKTKADNDRIDRVTKTINQGKTVYDRMQETAKTGPASQAKNAKKVGRNDPCPCGSGKKYKKCHGK
ncbi:preprotein translocase subunit SecA [Candidatus Berkelbacteria bacterium CG10_big_fil_rev_8_21_14_0_10_43_13]|uniref:Protein translocase subunit SecA n=1 Tax=Candidatus Berkelbacteria bacterium CG10_big_fil_rev_8_21_14_0_10_43_13 TaxID=1974514 RepID=A0A2H0W6V4_9BACT|nr:MAG: preprotein translocase subunit SecA [Candidatus Berkelbacteria bacterium CG10_big_fil_rev_8_21_14_0_10_43_13]